MLFILTLISGSILAAPVTSTSSNGSCDGSAARTALRTSSDEIVSLVTRGKLELLAGKENVALATFTLANEKNGGALVTEAWVLRAQIAIGELDEAFERIIEIEASGAQAIELDYVIGVARYEMARRAEREGGGSPGGAYQEAAAYLGEVTTTDGNGFPDAWKMLAAASRWTGDIEAASSAIDRALEVDRDGETLSLAAKIRIARGASLMGINDTHAAGKRAIAQGVKDARAAARAFGKRKKNAGALADVHLQRAVGLLFLEKKNEAASAYANALEWDPTQVNYGQLLGLFTDKDGTVAPFVDLLETGSKAYDSRWGKGTDLDASLQWWLGYGEYTLGRYPAAIDSFGRAFTKYPGYANAHWYIALSQYFSGKSHDEDAATSLRTFAELDIDGLTAMLASSADNKAYPGRVLFRLYSDGKYEAAADLAEVLLLTDETDPVLWNDVGLMSRDAGDNLKRAKTKESRKSAGEYYERAWVAYQRAIELDRKPYYLNDGAVILHYCLDRDPSKAIAMYDEAEEMALAMLAEGGLDDVEKDLVETALVDAPNNRAKLKERIARRKNSSAGR